MQQKDNKHLKEKIQYIFTNNLEDDQKQNELKNNRKIQLKLG